MHSQILYYKTKTFHNTVRGESQYNNHFPIYIKTFHICSFICKPFCIDNTSKYKMCIFKFYIIEIKRFTIENLLNLRSFPYLRTYTILVTIFFHRSTKNAVIYLYHSLLIMYTWNKFECMNILHYFPR